MDKSNLCCQQATEIGVGRCYVSPITECPKCPMEVSVDSPESCTSTCRLEKNRHCPVSCDYFSTDSVNHPSHYTSGEIECIDGLRSALGPDRFEGFCLGCTIKYLWRYKRKDKGHEDLLKAKWYLDRLIKETDGTSKS